MIEKFLHGLLLVGASASAADSVPRDVKAKYRALYELPVLRLPDGSLKFHNARLFRREGLNVLFLKGDAFEMAFQHGRLMKGEIEGGALEDLSEMMRRTLRNAMPDIPVGSDAYIAYTYKRISDRLIDVMLKAKGDRAMASVTSSSYGLAEGSGVDLKTVLQATVAPESMRVLTGERGAKAADAAGCSSAAAWGAYTPDGEVVIGRNTDFPVNGTFDRHATAIYFEPTDGGQRYLSISSAGVHTAGVLGMNESGIYMASHTIPTHEVSTSGTPVFPVVQDILAHARKIDDVLPMMKQYRYASGWAYSVISLQEKKALSIEISAKRVSGRVVEGDTYVHTNRYLHKDMLDAYAHINRAVDADAEARLARAGAMLESFRGAYVPAAAMAIVGDKYDLVNERLRAVGNTVAVHDTLTSVVVDGARGRVFMANGLAPVSLNTFVELPLPDRADPATFAASAYETVRNDSFKSQSPKLAASEQLFIHGKVAYEKRNDPHEARRLMDEAHALVADPHYRFVSGLLSLKLGDFDAARRAFVEVRGSWDEHLRYLGFYYGARVLAHEGRKAEALVELKALALALPAIETKLKDAVRKAVAKLERPLGGSLKINSSRLVVLIHQGDTVSYD